jgi:hypothetical protein
VKFVDINFTDDTKPTFMIYSYTEQKINYNDIADEVIANLNNAEKPALEKQRQKREFVPVPTCQVNDLIITRDIISHSMVGATFHPNFEVIFPEEFNAGICGGRCDTASSPERVSDHAPFVFLLLEQNSFRARHEHKFTRCCTPFEHRPLDILFATAGSNQIKTLHNMTITGCHCLDIVEFELPQF